MRCRLLSFAMLVAVSACATRPIARDPIPPVTPGPAGRGTVHARAFYLERMAMPTGATLELQLLGERDGDPTIDVIERRSFGVAKGPPYDVDLTFDTDRVRDGTRCSLRASLRDADGRLQFATQNRVPVPAGTPAIVEFRLIRVGAS